jgi:hypothetical protein
MSDLYSNDKIREKAKQLVRQNVTCCVSSLIYQITNPDGDVDVSTLCTGLGLSYEDDIMPILEIKDWDEAADNHIRNDMDRDELREYLSDQDVEFVDDEFEFDIEKDTVEHVPTEELRLLAIKAMEEQGAEEFCNENNIEPEVSEVFEHWIVDSWFAGKLAERGHPIAHDFLGMTIWGRPTTGQSISMDGVVLEIAAEMVKEYPES